MVNCLTLRRYNFLGKTPRSILKHTVTVHDLEFELYIPGDTIHAAITSVAEAINRDYEDAECPLLLVTLNGALVFAGELFRQLTGSFEVAFIKMSSYGAGMISLGAVSVDVPLTVDVAGRRVIIAEDIIDTGNTIHQLHAMLIERGAKEVRVATLLLKPAVYHATHPQNALPLDYVALEVEPKFIVGYGLDYNNAGRNLGAIYTLCNGE